MTRKEAILQAATILFSEKGFKETSMAELSGITDVAEGTIFYHFKNKEELLISILERTKEVITEEFEGYMRDREFKNGLDMLENTVAFYLYLAGKLETQFLLLHRHFPYKLAETNSVCRGHLTAIYDCLVDIFERAVSMGQADGSIADMPARKVALIIFSMVDGVVRFKTYNLYDAGALYSELISSCRKILTFSEVDV